jgi:predicted transcriptional regulator
VSLGWVIEREPDQVAAEVVEAARDRPAWLAEFTRALGRDGATRSSIAELRHVLSVWDMSQTEAARVFSVSRQAVSKWLASGVPREHRRALADLAAATDLLEHYLKRERIPAVVRRPASNLGSRSLLSLAAARDTEGLLRATRVMFDFAAIDS